jgi:hypothetical protein
MSYSRRNLIKFIGAVAKVNLPHIIVSLVAKRDRFREIEAWVGCLSETTMVYNPKKRFAVNVEGINIPLRFSEGRGYRWRMHLPHIARN